MEKNERTFSTIKIKLLLAKANVVINIASNSLVKLRTNIQKQCSKILENLPKQIFSLMLKNLPMQWEMQLNTLCIMKRIISSKCIKSLMSTIV